MGTSYEREGVHWHRREDGSWLRFNEAIAQWEAADRPDWSPPDPPPALWPAPPSAPVGPPSVANAERPKYPFKSRLTAGANLKVLLGLGVLLGLISAVLDVDTLRLIDDIRSGGTISQQEREFTTAREALVVGISGLLFVVTAIFFISWLYVAYKNLIPLGAARLGRRAGWAIGGWFVPLANLVIPKLVVDETYRQSDPETPVGVDPDARLGAVSPVVHWWWATYILSIVVGFVGQVMVGSPNATPDDVYSAASFYLVGDILFVAAGVLCFIVVHRIGHRQEERARRLGIIGGAPPQPAPSPSA